MLRQQQQMIDFTFFIGFVAADDVSDDCVPQTSAEKIGWAVALILSANARAEYYGCNVNGLETVYDDIATTTTSALLASERRAFTGLTTAAEKIRFLLMLCTEHQCLSDNKWERRRAEAWAGFFKYNKFKNMHKQFHDEMLGTDADHG